MLQREPASSLLSSICYPSSSSPSSSVRYKRSSASSSLSVCFSSSSSSPSSSICYKRLQVCIIIIICLLFLVIIVTIFIITIIIISLCFKGFQRCCSFASSSSSKSPQSLFQEFANSNERRLAFSKRKQFLVTKERKKVEGVIAIRDPSVSLWPPWLPTIQRFFIQLLLFESIFLGPGIMRVMSD